MWARSSALNAWLKPYPDTMNLKSRVHLRNHGHRPTIELEPTDHPLALEQRNDFGRSRCGNLCDYDARLLINDGGCGVPNGRRRVANWECYLLV